MYVYVISTKNGSPRFKPFITLNNACSIIIKEISDSLIYDENTSAIYKQNSIVSETSKKLRDEINSADVNKLSIEDINNIISSYEQYLKLTGHKSNCHYLKEIELVSDYLKPEEE